MNDGEILDFEKRRDILIDRIVERYTRECDDIKDLDRTAATIRILTMFTSMGLDLGKTVYSKYTKGEWLYDLCWSVEDKDWEFQNEHYLELVLESEWDPHWTEIATDFGKLLDSKAPIKVGVCSSRDKMETINRIKQMISTWKYKSNYERYIFFIHGDEEPEVTNYIILPSGDIDRKHMRNDS